MLTNSDIRLIAVDLAATCTTSLWTDANEPPPTGFTAGLTSHIEAWLRSPMLVAQLDEGELGAEYGRYLDRVLAGVRRRLQGYAEVRS